MNADGGGVAGTPPSSCGHHNPPGSRFCDVCGVKLPAQCSRCHVINRAEANFCGSCGAALGNSPRAHATPPVAPPRAAPDRAPMPSMGTAPATAETSAIPRRAENQRAAGPESFEVFSRMMDGHRAVDESQKTRDLMERVRERRRGARRRWVWLGAASAAIGIGIFGAALLFGGVPPRVRPVADRSAGAMSVVPAASPRGDAVPVQAATPQAAAPQAPATSGRDENLPAPPPRDGEQGRPTVKADRLAGTDRIEAPAVAQTPLPKTPGPDATVERNQEGPPLPPSAAKAPAVAPPRAGGELTFIVPAEPPSYDAHREETFALIHPAAPHYNTLLRIDPTDKTGTRIVGDLATSWTVSSDKRTYILKLRRGVKFHDGSEMTSRDVRATYEKIINPPPGITSVRKGEYAEIETVQTPEPYIVAFKLRWPSPSFIHSLASPWNWIYKADILERDIRWYETHVMGTGPFTFVEHVKGSHWVGRRNPDYWDSDRPYLDGYRALFIRDDAAQALAISSGRAHIQFRGFSPAQRDDIVRALGDKVTVQESPWNCGLVVAINHEQAAVHDRRVRRALSLALDRYQAATRCRRSPSSGRSPACRSPARHSPPRRPSSSSSPATGATSRNRGRRPGACWPRPAIAEGLSFVLKNRNIPMPYEHIGTWLVDQWRQIGLKVRQETQELRAVFQGSPRRQLRGQHRFPVRLRRRSRPGPLQVPVPGPERRQLRPVHRSRAGRPLRRPRAARWSPRSAGGTSATSKSASSTRRRTTSTRSSGTGSCRTARACAAGRSRPATTSTISSTRCGWRSSYRPASSRASNRAVARVHSNCVVTNVWPSRAIRSRRAPSSTSRPSPRARASTSRRGATTAVWPSIA